MINKPDDEIKQTIKELNDKHNNLTISLFNSNPMVVENLKKSNPLEYDNIIILSQSNEDYNPEKVDSDTLIILLIIRKIIKDLKIKKHKTKIITQVLNSENQELIQQSNADDFIISNKLISMIMAQLSENPYIYKFYDNIFKEEGSEIYLKKADLYFNNLPLKLTFSDMINVAQKRDEICLGYRLKKYANDPSKNFGIKLNPNKKDKLEITEDDLFVVLAEDEL
jgi:ribosome biogenesis SPOUT family RNA methylase Rps3